MHIVDTHTHLYLEEFDRDRDQVFQRAFKLGVKSFFIPAIDSTHTQRMLSLQARYPEHVFLMAGLHPTSVDKNWEKEIQLVKSQLRSEKTKYYALGEIGMDLYWDKSFIAEQKQAFRTQISLAKTFDLPIVIHCREAFDEIFEILDQENDDKLRGIFHCFTGDFYQAKKAISYNMCLGIGGVVTFKNGGIDRFLNQIDLKHIVLETDAPYLAPVPHRGKRNESSYLSEIIKKIALLYQLSEEEIICQTTLNSNKIFGS